MARVCEMFPNLAARLGQSGAKLSGGEQEMLATGRALVANPELMLMDEPTEGLAPLMVRELGRLVGALKEAGTSVLLVEQQLAFVLKFADRVYILSKGQVVHECTATELAQDSQTKARHLGV
jgi:branched-chain amino acid transport system ATP-binding protein